MSEKDVKRRRWYVPLPFTWSRPPSGAFMYGDRWVLNVYSVNLRDIRSRLSASGCCAYYACDFPQKQIVPRAENPRNWPRGASSLMVMLRRQPGARRLRFVILVYSDTRTAPRTNVRAQEAGTFEHVYHLRCLKCRVQEQFAQQLSNGRKEV